MKKLVLILIITFFSSSIYTQEIKYIETQNINFKPNDIVYLFGNDVKLRIKPSTESESIDIIKINSKVKIIAETNSTYNYNGIDWKWYKVNYNNKIGYIIGGLLSLDQKNIGDSTYLISLQKGENQFNLLIRLVNIQNIEYLELPYKLPTDTFSIKVYGNKGITAIKDMLLVDFVAEACGVNGGGCYFFNDGKSLIKAISYSEIVDADVYWLGEKVIFPNDNKGVKEKIVFVSEEEEKIDEETNHVRTKLESIEFTWKGQFLELKKEN